MTSAPVKGAARRLGPLRAGAVGICLLVAATGAVRAFAAPAAASAAASAAAAVESVYFELEIDGRRAGYAEEHERRAGDRVTTEQVFEIQIKRGEATVKLRQEARFVETDDAQPIEAVSKVWAGADATVRTVRYGDGGRRVETVQGGVGHVEELPPAEGFWVTPAAAGALVRAAFDERRSSFRLRTVDAAAGVDPFDVDYALRGDDEVTVGGERVAVTAYVVTTSLTPGLETVRYFDAAGEVVREELPLLPGVRRDPSDPHRLLVPGRALFGLGRDLMHLLGYRSRRPGLEEPMVFSRRRPKSSAEVAR